MIKPGVLTKLRDEVRGVYTKAEIAHEVIREAILSGLLPPGSPVMAGPISYELGMSLIPVREALKKLEQEGLLVVRPHAGTTVRELPASELNENLIIRGELEALATRLATPNVTPELMAELRALATEMEHCAETGSSEVYGRLNRKFHMTLYAASGLNQLYSLIDQLWDRIPRARSVFTLIPGYMVQSQHDHEELLAALEAGDAKLAEETVRRQKVSARDALMEIWEHPEEGTEAAADSDAQAVAKESS